MESNLMKSPTAHHVDGSDTKFISGLSTILVATIQEAKDRISQIEYIFCSQLYPNFQLTPQNLQKIYSDAKESAEVAFKEKENDLLLQIEKLQHQNQSLESEKSKFTDTERQSRNRLEELQKLLESKSSLLHSCEMTLGELEQRNATLQRVHKNLETEIGELRQELMKKSKEVDEVMELQNKLLQINQTKSSRLKEYEEKTKGLVFKLEIMENKANELLSRLRDKTEEVDKGKDVQKDFLRKIESQAREITNNEQLLIKYEKENRLLSAEVERSVNQKGLENEVDKLQRILSERTEESCQGMQLHGKLLQQIKVKDSELMAEKTKKMNVITAYKKLKSQYNYLLKKYSLTSETGIPLEKMENEVEIIRHNQTPATLHAVTENDKASSIPGDDVTKPVDELDVLDDKKVGLFVQRSKPISPSTSNINIAAKCPDSIKTCPPAGAKRPLSYWRDTRSHQSRVGPDPHDDFLDTPLENVRQNVGKAAKKDNTDLPKPVGPRNTNLDDSDDLTQDMNVDDDDGPQNPHTKVGTSGFKYVGPVRKKSERENLKGVECKQCRKFYDAVLPGTGKTADGGGDNQNIRCEHQDGVSRHRYRYAPPSTPEGFWNIGFESEM